MESLQLKSGTIIQGEWSKKKYQIKQKIGEGGIGVVYLAEDVKTNKDYAMKVSKDNLSLNREYQMLKKFCKIDMIVDAYEIDDCKIEKEVYYYIILEYVEGVNLKVYTENNKLEKITILGIIFIILKGLEGIHKEEYIIVDLKLENIMLDNHNQQIKIIDLGAAVKKGNSIKEFTPQYDRGSWRCGDRIAEESYDLFAVMILLTKLILREDLNPKRQNINTVFNMLKKAGVREELLEFIIKGLMENNIPLEFFLNKFKHLYNIERINSKRKQILLRNRKIDFMLLGSIFLFLATMILIITN